MNKKTNLQAEDDFQLTGVSISAVDVMQQKFPVKFRGYDVSSGTLNVNLTKPANQRISGTVMSQLQLILAL